MSCDRYSPMISAYLDGELPEEDRRRLEKHLAACPACARELADLKGLTGDLDMMRFKEPTDVEFARYWSGVYNRLERGLGWIVASLGAILLLSYGGFCLVEGLIRDHAVSWAVKIGLSALIFGGVVLFVSLLRERLAVRRADRYAKEVER